MAKNAMKNAWDNKRRENERLQKVQIKKKPITAAKETTVEEREADKQKDL